jgi:putative DNA primase/helicase
VITQIKNIPKELTTLPNWVCWKSTDKIPYNPATGKPAMANNKNTWGTFKQAVKACDTFGFDGIGFEFQPPYFGVDIDNCLEDEDLIEEFTESLQSYTEISRSGQGIHIICKGELPEGKKRKNNVEMYQNGRYFILTGNLYSDKYTTITDCTESIKILKNKYLPNDAPAPIVDYESISLDDTEIIDKARGCRTGYLFEMLYNGNWEGVYPSQSEADLTFCNLLAFWTQRNSAQMDRIFRSSKLYRKKWDSRRNGTTYGAITINNAIEHCTEVYDPKKHINDEAITISMFTNGEMSTAPSKMYDMTDTGNAQRFFDEYGNIFRYSYYRKKWFYWNGKQWLVDDVGYIKRMADNIIDKIKREASREADEDVQKALFKWAIKTASSRAKEAMIKECQHLDGIPVTPDEFDAAPDYINCQNGIVNLKNGELLKHDPAMLMTKICLADYPVGEGVKEPKMWLKFLDDITGGDKELQEYIQRCIGYSLTGRDSEQCAFFLHGNGNNGKSTFIETLADLFGGYAMNAQPDTIMIKKRESGANTDVARLKSARFVTVEEPTEGVRLNEGLLKQLTGGSKVTARHLYGEEFEYYPEFKIWCATNHKPVIRGTDLGIWRRIKLIPFEVRIPKEKIDKNLRYNLRSEFPQILYWAVQGAIKWYTDGINEPEIIRQAVNEYKNEMDLLASFIEECLREDNDSEIVLRAADLFQLYSKWAKTNNEYEMTSKKFFREIGKKFPDLKKRDGAGIYYVGLKITESGCALSGRQYKLEDFR